MSSVEPDAPLHPFTLGADIGGSGLKAAVLDAQARMVTDRLRIETPYPLRPERLVNSLASMAGELAGYDRVSVGFNGMVRHGIVITAPQFSRIGGLGTPVDDDLVAAWHNFNLAKALEDELGKPTRVANDADVQGAAVVEGKGLEMVVTLGTGCGTALFYDGGLLPHMEFAHHPLHGDETYNDYVGDSAMRQVGEHKCCWHTWWRQAMGYWPLGRGGYFMTSTVQAMIGIASNKSWHDTNTVRHGELQLAQRKVTL